MRKSIFLYKSHLTYLTQRHYPNTNFLLSNFSLCCLSSGSLDLTFDSGLSSLALVWLSDFPVNNPNFYGLVFNQASLIAQLVKNPPAMQETLVRFLVREDLLEKGKATHSSVLAWRMLWTV